MFVAPDWQGKVPNGIKRVIQGESSFLGTLTRTQNLSGAGGMDRVREIQQAYSLQRLSAFAGTEARSEPVETDWPMWTEGDEATLKFFEYVDFLLPLTVAHPDDAGIYERMAQIGLGNGVSFASADLDEDMRDALQAGIDDAREELKSLSEQSFDPALFFNTREVVGSDYINRALGVYVGIFGNTTDQAVYFTEPNDADGIIIDGSKASYTVTFEAGKLPPVNYFWSYTMYRLPERLLVDNPLDRYSIGSPTEGLQANEDGSVIIHFSKDSPGEDKESNWLPAPDGPFWAVLRTYGPNEEILGGSWTQPPFMPTQ